MEGLQRRLTLAREWQCFLAQFPVLLCPVSAESPFPDMLDVESPESFARVLEAQIGSSDQPMGVQLVAARFREDVLLAAAADIEARNAPLEVADPD